MNTKYNQRQLTRAFTLIELVIVIAVIAILAALSAVGYGTWRKTMAANELKSDLTNLASAMESKKNFGNGYPLLTANSTFDGSGTNASLFKSSSNVTLTYIEGSASSFCIEAKSKTYPTLTYYMNTTDQKTPVQGTCADGPGEPVGPSKYLAVSVGQFHTCAIASDKNAYCWGGGNGRGMVGDGTGNRAYNPTATVRSGVLAGKTIRALASGGYHTCAIASDSNAYCWGSVWGEELGNGSSTGSLVPVAVSTAGVLSGKTINSITAGNTHTCAIASDNNAYCWGSGGWGQLGNGSDSNYGLPIAVTTSGALSGKTIQQISAGNTHTCAIASDNNAYCWGSGEGGEIGSGTTLKKNLSPVAVDRTGALMGKTVKSISAGSASHTCAIASDNNAYCWGYNTKGQLGNGTTNNSSVPIAVNRAGALAGKSILDIAAGEGYTCAIASDNNAYCWGLGANGQLGNGSNTDSSVPVAVTTNGVLSGKTARKLSVNDYSACIIASDNNAYCWGYGGFSFLGDGTGSDSNVPVKVKEPY